MLNVTVIAVGKLKESRWREAQEEYARRLRPFAKIEVIEVAAEPFGGSVTPAQAMRTEAERLERRLPKGATVIMLERTGGVLSSEAFAKLVGAEADAGREVAFVIGGAAGLDPAFLAAADKKISISAMTFTHEMARIILLEQLYRATTILAGKTYHY